MRQFKTAAGDGRYKVESLTVLTGKDIVAIFGGGRKYHIGACALATARQSLAQKNHTSASVSVLCLSGHQEDQLARMAALALAAKYNCVVNVVVGLHLDQATQEDIAQLVANFNACLFLVEKSLDEYLEQKVQLP